MDSGRLQPAFFGGLLIGVLSALPIVSAGNCCCCLWVVAGGMLAVYLRQQNSPFAVTSAEGALVGLLAGVIGAVVGHDHLDSHRSDDGAVPASAHRAGDQFATGYSGRNARHAGARQRRRPRRDRRCVQVIFMLITGTIFGMLGGLLGVAVFKKDAPPPPPPGTVEILPPE